MSDEFLHQVHLLIQMHKKGLLGGETMPEDALLGMDEVSYFISQ